MTGNRKQRQWVIMAAKELGLMPTTEGGLDFKMNLTEVLDGYPGHEHSYPIMPLYQDEVQLIAQSGITYTPTLLVSTAVRSARTTSTSTTTSTTTRRCGASSRTRDRPSGRSAASGSATTSTCSADRRESAARGAAGRRQRGDGLPRSAGRPRLSLGAVGHVGAGG